MGFADIITGIKTDGFSLFGYLFLLTKYSRKPINCLLNRGGKKTYPSRAKFSRLYRQKGKDEDRFAKAWVPVVFSFPFFLPSSPPTPNMA